MRAMKNVVVVGGGTGTFTVLSGLRKYPLELAAVVSMADDGGSTGVLRDELGVLPPGDIRQCLVALSHSEASLRDLMNYRFAEGGLKGHTFGNILLSALEKMTGSFDKAVETAAEVLRIQGKVVPATLSEVRLVAYLKNGNAIRGESAIRESHLGKLRKIVLEPRAKPNPEAINALKQANLIVIGPGDLYSSLIPNLLIPGVSQAITSSRAKKAYVCNLMTKQGHTDGFTVQDYVRKIEAYLNGTVHCVIFNNERPSTMLLKRYAHEGEHFVEIDENLKKTPVLLAGKRYVGDALISKTIFKPPKEDTLPRTLIRHDADRLAKLLLKFI